METMFWIWIAAAVVFVIIELITPTLIFVSFVAGAATAGIYAQFAPESYYVQIALFLVISLALLPFTRRLAQKITKESPTPSNVDRLIGSTAIVTKAIDPNNGGRVKFEGEIWFAEAADSIHEGAKVRITEVTGTRVRVEKVSQHTQERTD